MVEQEKKKKKINSAVCLIISHLNQLSLKHHKSFKGAQLGGQLWELWMSSCWQWVTSMRSDDAEPWLEKVSSEWKKWNKPFSLKPHSKVCCCLNIQTRSIIYFSSIRAKMWFFQIKLRCTIAIIWHLLQLVWTKPVVSVTSVAFH